MFCCQEYGSIQGPFRYSQQRYETNSNVHQTAYKLSLYQSGAIYVGIKIFNSPSSHIKDFSHNIKEFSLFKFILYVA